MAERWRAEIRYWPGTGHPSSTLMFDTFANLGELIETDQNPDEIESIIITSNRPAYRLDRPAPPAHGERGEG
jgi:hypothetical protein